MKTDRSSQEETFPCYLSKGAGITEDLCEERTSVYAQNLGTCCAKECRSPWRICPACVVQIGDEHLLGPKDSVLPASHDQKGGLCKFHRAKGEKADREDFDKDHLPDELLTMFGDPKTKPKKGASPQPAPVATSVDSDGKNRVLTVPIDRVRPSKRYQPRRYFDVGYIRQLSDGIKMVGQLTPATVVRIYDDPLHDFELIGGECRLKAITLAGLSTIDVIIREINGKVSALAIAMGDNSLRFPLAPIETARGVKGLKEEGWSNPDIAKLIGNRSIQHVQNMLRLLTLDPRVLELLEPEPSSRREGERGWVTKLSYDIALRLTKYSHDEQWLHASHIVEMKMSTGQAIAYLRNLGGETVSRPAGDYNRLLGYVAHTEHWLGNVFKLKAAEFSAMFARRSSDTVRTLAGRIRADIDKLNELLALIESAKK